MAKTQLAGASAPRAAALSFIFITVTLDMISFGIIAPVLPKLIIGMLGGNSVRAAQTFGVFATVFALMQFVFAPLFGVLSDQIGRRPVIILSTLGLGLDYVLMALAPNLSWLFVGRVVSGITSANQTTASAYIADTVPAERRAAAFGLLGAAFGLGFIIGPAVGGLLGSINPRLPFWCAAGLSLAGAIYGAVVLPESLPRSARRSFAWRRANPISALGLLRSHRELSALAVVTFLSVLAGVVLPSVWVLYADYRFAWDERAIGLSLAVVGVAAAVVQAVLVRPIVSRLGERRAVVAGLGGGTLGLLMYGLAGSGVVFTLGTPIMMLWGVAPAAAQALMTEHVDATEQGELQGALGSLRGIGSLVGPGIFTLTFAAFVGPLRGWNIPGAPWLLAAGLLIAALIVAARLPAVHVRYITPEIPLS